MLDLPTVVSVTRLLVDGKSHPFLHALGQRIEIRPERREQLQDALWQGLALSRAVSRRTTAPTLHWAPVPRPLGAQARRARRSPVNPARRRAGRCETYGASGGPARRRFPDR